MEYTFEFLLDDLRTRGMGIQFGNDNEAKEKALDFKQYAEANGEKVHVILDEIKRWAVITDSNYKIVDKAWKERGKPGMKSYN